MIIKQESTTAKLCAFARAHHSNYSKEKIFDDYLAFDLIGTEANRKIAGIIAGIPSAGTADGSPLSPAGRFSKE